MVNYLSAVNQNLIKERNNIEGLLIEEINKNGESDY